MVCRVVALGAALGHGTCADLPSARTVTEGCDLMAPGCVSPLPCHQDVRSLRWVGPAPAEGSCQRRHDRTGRCLWLQARPTLGIIPVVPFNLGSILLNGFDDLE